MQCVIWRRVSVAELKWDRPQDDKVASQKKGRQRGVPEAEFSGRLRSDTRMHVLAGGSKKDTGLGVVALGPSVDRLDGGGCCRVSYQDVRGCGRHLESIAYDCHFVSEGRRGRDAMIGRPCVSRQQHDLGWWKGELEMGTERFRNQK